ncbi:hypothetical protein D3C76_1205410 [compost metagenome]
MHRAIQQAGDQKADQCQHTHQAEHIVVALLTREVVQDCTVDHVGKHAGCIADQAADTKRRTGNALGNAHFAHGSPEYTAHGEYNEREAQGARHAGIDEAFAFWHQHDHGHQGQQRQERPLQVTGRALEAFVCHEAACRATQYLEEILVDDAIGANQGHWQPVHILQVRNEVGQAAVNDVNHEHVQAHQPDTRYPDGFEQARHAGGLFAYRLSLAILEQEPGDDAGSDVDQRIEQDG